MGFTAISDAIEENLAPSVSRRLTEVVADAYAFIRSAEANKAFATVTLEQLMQDQIDRNGETARSNAAKYNPYSYRPGSPDPSGVQPSKVTNFLGASDTGLPTKLDRILAIKNELGAVIAEIKSMAPVDVASPQEYTDALDVGTVSTEEE